jgi:hypothetical protein
VGTFASGATPEPGDHVIPHASIVLPCFDEEDHVLLEIERNPLHFASDTILIFVTGMILASMALLADLIVRSRADP